MTYAEMEVKIKDLLEQKLQEGDLAFLHGFYTIPNLYNYSFYNRMLIAIQGGSIVAGFDRWNKMGRHVKRGEKASIEILVPVIRKYKAEKNGEEVEREHCAGFIGRKVFDIKQTDGKELAYQNNSDEVLDLQFDTIAPKLAAALKVKIATGFTGEARGSFNRLTNDITISSMSNNANKCKTLFHEIGHLILHKDGDEGLAHREVEAELVATLTANSLGVDFKQSALYIASYNQHKPNIQVLKVIGAVQRILKTVLATEAVNVI